jgi:hypothetical protein
MEATTRALPLVFAGGSCSSKNNDAVNNQRVVSSKRASCSSNSFFRSSSEALCCSRRRLSLQRRTTTIIITNAKERREDSDYEDEINKLSIGDIDEIFASAAAKENSEDIEDVLKRELRLRKKIDEAEEKLERGREKINELAEKKKEELDREMSLMQDKNSLEFGLIANDLDAELKKMAEESEIAKKRNEALKEELRLLAEELARGTSRASRREKGVNAIDVDRKKEKEVNPLTRKLADEEAMNTDEKMRKTLAETQRGATFFMLKLLLGIVVIFELARGEFAVSSALAAALALVFYQSEAEKANEGGASD